MKISTRVRINPQEFEGRIHKGKEFIVDSIPRNVCGTEVVALNHANGARFSAAYNLSMLEIEVLKNEGRCFLPVKSILGM